MLYEAPTRVAALLRDLAELVPDARVAVGRELTKLHEEVRVGTASELAADPPMARGEFTVVVSGLAAGGAPAAERSMPPALARMALELGLSERGAVELLRAAGIARREAYRVARDAAVAHDAGGRERKRRLRPDKRRVASLPAATSASPGASCSPKGQEEIHEQGDARWPSDA